MISLDIVIVLVVVLFLVIALYTEISKPITAFFIAIVTLSTFKILSPKEVLTGFSNEQIAIIILLLIIGKIIQATGVLDFFYSKVLKQNISVKGFLARMILYVSTSSAFFNNTPLVAMMMPYVDTWSRKKKISKSKLLIPLSYAAILGGCATLIGTSTNLLVNGMAIENGVESINIFDFAYVGVPMIFIGFLYLYFFSYRLLPDKKGVLENFQEHSREYLVEAFINKDSHLIGKSIEQAKLRNLKGLFLVEIIREGRRLPAVSPDTELEERDKLIFAGQTDNVVELLRSGKGLAVPQADRITQKESSMVVEVVVSQNSTLVNKNVRKGNFRSRFDAVIVAVHRNGERLTGKIGDVVLKAGDILLLLTGKNFEQRKKETADFHYITKVHEIPKVQGYKRIVLLGGLMLAIILSALKVFSFFKGLIILLALVVVLRIASLEQIKQSIEFKIIAIDGMSLALGKAMLNSGTAEWLANHTLNMLAPLGIFGLLIGIYLITNILASYMTNVAAVSIIFPISLALARSLLETGQIETITPFIIVVATAGAANFITPIGYQTNLMVYGTGGYSFKDFFKIGFPLTILYMIATVTILGFVYNIY